MRSRYRIFERDFAYVVTGTIVAWLPIFTTAYGQALGTTFSFL